jgi:hypothetical protein
LFRRRTLRHVNVEPGTANLESNTNQERGTRNGE